MTMQEVLSRLRGVRQCGDGWEAFCPAHEDRHRQSLSVSTGDDARILLHCHRGCSTDAVLAALRMSMGDLYPAARTNGHHPARGGRIVVTYDYTDSAGTLVYQVCRFEPKDFRCRRPDGQGGWTWKLTGITPLLYRLSALAEAPRVWVVEGEKDADALAALGLAATCNHGGAGKWREEHTAALVAVAVPEVVVIPDNDDPGRAHAQAVARSCAAAGLAVKVVALDGVPEKGDVSDWLAAGHAEHELFILAAAAAPIAEDGPVLRRLSEIEAAPVVWTWRNRIARGKLTLLVGEVAAGKTSITLDYIARRTRGLPWPDGEVAPVGDVLLLASEDGIADTIRPGVDRQGGNPSRVHILDGVRVKGAPLAFTFERDLTAFDAAIARTHAGAAIISPLSAYLGSKDSYKDAEVRGLLTPLAALAERRGVELLAIMHLTKGQTTRLIHRVQGSVAFVAQARVVLVVGEDPNVAGRRLMVANKNNLGPVAKALAFRISDTGVLTWEPDPIEGTADTLLAPDVVETRTEARERIAAQRFLADLLAPLPVKSGDVYKAAHANGISKRTLWRAKVALKITAERTPPGDNKAPWYWLLAREEEA
jgi:hypothetical protein